MDDDAGLSAELAAAVEGARRRAVRDGDRQIDTAHLLHSLLENDPEVRAAFDGGPQLARLFGYLVQRSIGYGLRWQGGVEDSGALPVVTTVEGFSPLASAALRHARLRAAGRPGPQVPDAGRPACGDIARGVDLLAAILADPQARAVEVLARAGVDPLDVCARIEVAVGGYDGCAGFAEEGDAP
ncbi:peptidase [Streptomyces phaeoluteigriseus]|uniref:Peptidase n=1 Tax=Streptomyces phaeoluteigriseus TaxID=114686 RepID=A0ABY4ZEZ4_9ACTN|nr:Clp protease N-terminal domain-containing protein [Streptomyces phaeoluteigriseus]USQ87080.1 peptidase [Streptomyces phaeoluteigriseus]